MFVKRLAHSRCLIKIKCHLLQVISNRLKKIFFSVSPVRRYSSFNKYSQHFRQLLEKGLDGRKENSSAAPCWSCVDSVAPQSFGAVAERRAVRAVGPRSPGRPRWNRAGLLGLAGLAVTVAMAEPREAGEALAVAWPLPGTQPVPRLV